MHEVRTCGCLDAGSASERIVPRLCHQLCSWTMHTVSCCMLVHCMITSQSLSCHEAVRNGEKVQVCLAVWDYHFTIPRMLAADRGEEKVFWACTFCSGCSHSDKEPDPKHQPVAQAGYNPAATMALPIEAQKKSPKILELNQERVVYLQRVHFVHTHTNAYSCVTHRLQACQLPLNKYCWLGWRNRV
jgi:hypothetical protein